MTAKNAVFVSAALHGENGSKSENGIFCYFGNFCYGILAKLNELESESDKIKGEVDSLVNFPISTSPKTIAHSALLT